MKIKIEIGDEVFKATLTKDFSPKTVEKIVGALPIESEAREWGMKYIFAVNIVGKIEEPDKQKRHKHNEGEKIRIYLSGGARK